MRSRQAVTGAARITRSASANAASGFACGGVEDPLLDRLPRPRAGGRPGGHRPVRGRRVLPDGSCDRTGDQAEADEPEVHVAEYRSRRTARCVDRSLNPASPPCRSPPLAGTTTHPAAARCVGRPRGVPAPHRSCLSVLPFGRGGPGSFVGLVRRCISRRSVSRRSSCRNAPQRGQRRSSANSELSGAVV